MSNITKETIDKVAKLANIKIDETNKDHLCDQLTKITNWVESLNEVDTDNIEILSSVHNSTITLFDDEIEQNNKVEDVLKNAPDAQYNYFAVPKVIE